MKASHIGHRGHPSASTHNVAGYIRNKCKVHNLLDIDGLGPRAPDVTSEVESAPPSIPELVSPTLSASSELSELTTKEDLGKMAMSVRDLSRSLSKLNVKIEIRSILIVSKIYDESLIPLTRNLAMELLSMESLYGPLHVYVQDTLKDHPEFAEEKLRAQCLPDAIHRLQFWDVELCATSPNLFDLVLTLGGDGTVLYAGWLFQQVVPPVLCFRLGSLGFMTQFDFSRRAEIMESILKDGLRCSLRMRFQCTIMRSRDTTGKGSDTLIREIEQAEFTRDFPTHKIGETHTILNDVVVDRGPNPTITTTELYGDCHYLTAIEADGVVISTPTGSTAYSLSAGGSLVNPDLPAILVSPICPHTLSFRPLVLQDSIVVRIGVPYDARISAWCSFDGKKRVELQKGDFLSVSVSPYPFPLVQNQVSNSAWFESLSKTLHWNQRERQKAFD